MNPKIESLQMYVQEYNRTIQTLKKIINLPHNHSKEEYDEQKDILLQLNGSVKSMLENDFTQFEKENNVYYKKFKINYEALYSVYEKEILKQELKLKFKEENMNKIVLEDDYFNVSSSAGAKGKDFKKIEIVQDDDDDMFRSAKFIKAKEEDHHEEKKVTEPKNKAKVTKEVEALSEINKALNQLSTTPNEGNEYNASTTPEDSSKTTATVTTESTADSSKLKNSGLKGKMGGIFNAIGGAINTAIPIGNAIGAGIGAGFGALMGSKPTEKPEEELKKKQDKIKQDVSADLAKSAERKKEREKISK